MRPLDPDYALVADEEATHLTDPIDTLMGLCGTLTLASTNGDYPRPVVLDERARRCARARRASWAGGRALTAWTIQTAACGTSTRG